MKRLIAGALFLLLAATGYSQTYEPVTVDMDSGIFQPDITALMPQAPTAVVENITLDGVSISSWYDLLSLLSNPPYVPIMPTYMNDIPSYMAGPIAWYAFNETRTNLYFDTSSNRFDLLGSPVSARAPSVLTGAAHISKANEGFISKQLCILSNQYAELTVAAWIKATALPEVDHTFVSITPSNQYTSGQGLQLSFTRQATTNGVVVSLYGSSATGERGVFATVSNTAASFCTGVWSRVVVTYSKQEASDSADASVCAIYFDGVLAGTHTVSNWFVSGLGADNTPYLAGIGIGALDKDGYVAITNDYYVDDVVFDSRAWSFADVTNDFYRYRTLAHTIAQPEDVGVENVLIFTADVTFSLTDGHTGDVWVLASTGQDAGEVFTNWWITSYVGHVTSTPLPRKYTNTVTSISSGATHYFRVYTSNEVGYGWSTGGVYLLMPE